MQETIEVNKPGRVTGGICEGVVGHVIGANWEEKRVYIRDSEGFVLVVNWYQVEQFVD